MLKCEARKQLKSIVRQGLSCLTHLSNMRKKNIIKMINYKELKIYETIKLLYLHPCFDINAG